MSLETNIERIAAALEALVALAGARTETDNVGAADTAEKTPRRRGKAAAADPVDGAPTVPASPQPDAEAAAAAEAKTKADAEVAEKAAAAAAAATAKAQADAAAAASASTAPTVEACQSKAASVAQKVGSPAVVEKIKATGCAKISDMTAEQRTGFLAALASLEETPADAFG